MSAHPRLKALAAATPNFGYLLPHEALLVSYGAAAEAAVYTDPNTSMVKCRQFGEALTARAFLQFGIPKMPDKQFQRLKVLIDQGFLTTRVTRWFDGVRKIGNKATHENHDAQRDALLLVRACYELGAWFHETVTGRRDAPPFVPPQPPSGRPPSDTAPELRQLLERYRAELVEMKSSVAEHQAQAEAVAQAAADAAVRKAVEAQDDLRKLVTELAGQVTELQQQLTSRAEKAPPIDAALRDQYVEQAAAASRPRLTEAQTRRIIDRMLDAAGWVVQDRADTNVHVAPGVAVREVPTADGRADYLLYVDAKLVGAIEAKREGTSLGGVDAQTARYAVGLAAGQKLAAWRTPLPFRYESTATDTRFTNALDPITRPRRVFSFHRPETIARWMRAADDHPDAPTLRARLCVVEPTRFLPILTYTSPAGGKKEIAASVFDLDLPAPQTTSMTTGRLAF